MPTTPRALPKFEIRDRLADIRSHEWTEYEVPLTDESRPGWKMAKCSRCGFDMPTEETTVFPRSCDEELVRNVMRE